jgi:hypothetical protein
VTGVRRCRNLVSSCMVLTFALEAATVKPESDSDGIEQFSWLLVETE